MFTGIIEEIGTVENVRRGRDSAVLTIACARVLEGTRLGDSIAVNGICLTVTALAPHSFSADVMHETLRRSSLARIQRGTRVNLERAMAANGRFGGHIVSGHVDATAPITRITRDDNAIWYTIAAPPALLRYVVEKGSITIDGISLTVAAVTDSDLSISAIPHTVAHTTLSDRRLGDLVNLEADILAKYVEKLLHPAPPTGRQAPPADSPAPQSGITQAFLAEHGF